MSLRVLICGSRYWTDYDAILAEVAKLPPDSVVIAGGARGADRLAAQAARASGLQVVEYPANWASYGRAAGSIRDRQMLIEGRPDRLLAFTKDLASSRGTRNMVEQARKANLPCEIKGDPSNV